MSQYDTHPWIPDRSIDEIPEIVALITQLKSEYGDMKARRAAKAPAPAVSRLAGDLLRVAHLHPHVPCVHLWRMLTKTTPMAQEQARQELAAKELARFLSPQLGSSKRQLIVIMPKGYEFLHLPVPTHQEGGGNDLHRSAEHWIAGACQKRGYKNIVIEFQVPGTPHRADVAARTEHGLELWEFIDTCATNIMTHIEHSFSQDLVAKLHIVSTQKTLRDEIKQFVRSHMLLSEHLQRIEFEVIDSYLKELFP